MENNFKNSSTFKENELSSINLENKLNDYIFQRFNRDKIEEQPGKNTYITFFFFFKKIHLQLFLFFLEKQIHLKLTPKILPINLIN